MDDMRHCSTCRLCKSNSLHFCFSLNPTPLANSFVTKEGLDKEIELYPLNLYLCDSCGHLQLLDVLDPNLLFSNYLYVSGTSTSFTEHFRFYAKEIVHTYSISPGSLVVDIGSNDGTLLKFFKEESVRVLGIDPAQNIAKESTERGIYTIPKFFTLDLAKEIRWEHGKASVVTANNVFAHVDDLDSMIKGVKELLTNDGIFVFEVSYLGDVYQKLLFDTIYHEHLSYHSVKPLVRFFRNHNMELIDVKRVNTHGGSIRCVVKLLKGKWKVSSSVDKMVEFENSIKLGEVKTFISFIGKIEDLKKELTTLLSMFKSKNKTIVGFGAPAKATTLMYHMGLSSKVIDYIVDDSPLKQGLYSPGLHIPIVPVSVLYERNPDKILVLAWNFADSIISKHPKFNGRYIVPIPTVVVK